MGLIFTKHFLERYETRRFILSLIRQILLKSDRIEDQNGGAKLYMKLDENKGISIF